MRQAGRYHDHYQNLKKDHTFEELCKKPKLAAETAMGPINEFDFDVAILFSDILFPLEALGMDLSYNPGPQFGLHLNEDNAESLIINQNPINFMEFQGEAIERTIERLPNEKSLIGFIFGLTSSIGFSVFSVTLRWRKETPKFTTVAFAGLFCFVFATIVILTNDLVFFSTSYNGSLFSLHGTLVCFGLILYSIGSKAIPAAELTLLSLTEVVGGIFWVWLPILGINEIPSTNTIIGGFFLFVSLFYYSLIMRWNKRYIALN